MENTMSALSYLRFLTASVVDAPQKTNLRSVLKSSLESTEEFDLEVVETALDRFFGKPLTVVPA